MQERQMPIEGDRESEPVTPTRTGDNVPTSDVTPQEAKTMSLAPLIFGVGALIIVVIVVVLFFALR